MPVKEENLYKTFINEKSEQLELQLLDKLSINLFNMLKKEYNYYIYEYDHNYNKLSK